MNIITENFEENNFILDEVVEIVELDRDDEFVYDLSVEDTETFFARDPNSEFSILCHNSSMYPSIGISFNISPNTYMYKLDIDLETLARWVYEGKLSEQDANRVIDVVIKPMTWFGVEGELGIKTQMKIKEIFKIIEENNYIVTMAGSVFKSHEEEVGFHADLLIELRKQRKYYQKLEKEAKERGDKVATAINNKAQLARKVVMNGGYYGAQGTDSFNFFDIGMAEGITVSARVEISYVCHALEEFILSSEEKVQKLIEAAKG